MRDRVINTAEYVWQVQAARRTNLNFNLLFWFHFGKKVPPAQALRQSNWAKTSTG